uniref:Uncharacterized protein n=1 Tax=Anguilla anguilla TaxID=7936 RepID=A0A0E9XJG0_ANGAN
MEDVVKGIKPHSSIWETCIWLELATL